MNDFSDNQDEAGHKDDSVGEDGRRGAQMAHSSISGSGQTGDSSAGLSEEENPMLTKVADLLDDIVESDRKLAPSLNEKWQSPLNDQKEESAHDHSDLDKAEAGTVPGKSSPINANQSLHRMGDDKAPEAQNEIIIRIINFVNRC